MILDNQYPQILKILEEKKSFVICMPKTVSTDGQASATALYLALSKAGKQVTLVAEDQPLKETDVVASEKIVNDLQAQDGNTLVISFPYHQGAVDKITSDVVGDDLKIFVAPSAGAQKLNTKDVKFSYTGGKIDVIITIETARLDNLGKIYANNQDKFSGVDIINIDRRFNNSQFGTVNVVEKQASSLAEIILSILNYLKIDLDKDISTNLYTGLVYATNNFTSYSVNADTFDIASRLLRSGAIKKPFVKKDLGLGPQQPAPFAQMNQNQNMGVFNQPYSQPAGQYNDDYYDDEEDDYIDDYPQMDAPVPPMGASIPQTGQQMNQPFSQTKNIADNQTQPITNENQQPTDNQNTPSDWLKPKIFKGSSNLV